MVICMVVKVRAVATELNSDEVRSACSCPCCDRKSHPADDVTSIMQQSFAAAVFTPMFKAGISRDFIFQSFRVTSDARLHACAPCGTVRLCICSM